MEKNVAIIWEGTLDGSIYYRMAKAYNPEEDHYYYVMERSHGRNVLDHNWIQVHESDGTPQFNDIVGKALEKLSHLEKLNLEVRAAQTKTDPS